MLNLEYPENTNTNEYPKLQLNTVTNVKRNYIMVNFKRQYILKGTKCKIPDGYCKNHGMLFFLKFSILLFYFLCLFTENEPVSQEAIL